MQNLSIKKTILFIVNKSPGRKILIVDEKPLL